MPQNPLVQISRQQLPPSHPITQYHACPKILTDWQGRNRGNMPSHVNLFSQCVVFADLRVRESGYIDAITTQLEIQMKFETDL